MFLSFLFFCSAESIKTITETGIVPGKSKRRSKKNARAKNSTPRIIDGNNMELSDTCKLAPQSDTPKPKKRKPLDHKPHSVGTCNLGFDSHEGSPMANILITQDLSTLGKTVTSTCYLTDRVEIENDLEGCGKIYANQEQGSVYGSEELGSVYGNQELGCVTGLESEGNSYGSIDPNDSAKAKGELGLENVPAALSLGDDIHESDTMNREYVKTSRGTNTNEETYGISQEFKPGTEDI